MSKRLAQFYTMAVLAYTVAHCVPSKPEETTRQMALTAKESKGTADQHGLTEGPAIDAISQSKPAEEVESLSEARDQDEKAGLSLPPKEAPPSNDGHDLVDDFSDPDDPSDQTSEVDGIGEKPFDSEPSNDPKDPKVEKKPPAKAQVIFTSSETFDGNFLGNYLDQSFSTGLEGADFRCQSLADSAGLEGTFKALLGDSNWDLDERIKFSSKIYNTINQRVTKKGSQLGTKPKSTTTKLLTKKLSYDEHGRKVSSPTVWTGLNSEYDIATWRNCQDWTTNVKKERGKFGKANKKDYRWFSKAKSSARCHKKLRLYCIKQD